MTKILAIIASFAVFACGEDNEPDASADAAPPAAPEVTLSNPPTVTRGETLDLEVEVTDFRLVDPTTTPPPTVAPGTGHFHIYFDDSPEYSAGWTPVVPIQTAESSTLGAHTIRIVLVNSNHTEVVPTTEATTSFTIE